MENPALINSEDLMKDLDIRKDTIIQAPFQGEICTVFNAHSGIHGNLIIKTALKNGRLRKEGQKEIRQNKEGYPCIPSEFRPEIIATDVEDTFLVMTNVGKPLRDLLWLNQNSLESSVQIVDVFIKRLIQLFSQTKGYDPSASNAFLDQLENMGNIVLQSEFFPQQLREGFKFNINKIRQAQNGSVALATLDMTQGNLLIDIDRSPQTLKIIDPKQPRLVRGRPTFLGIPEIDLGMFFVTLNLNAPPEIRNLRIEEKLTGIGLDILPFEFGKLFGHILIAVFPNRPERVGEYFKSTGASWDEDVKKLVVKERENHIQEAIKISRSMESL